jgi:LPXTG-motif cell wall-anchored protein
VAPTPPASSQQEDEVIIEEDLVARGAPSPLTSPAPSAAPAPAQADAAAEELILEDTVPLGALPKTGETSRAPYLFVGFMMLVSGLALVRTRKSK